MGDLFINLMFAHIIGDFYCQTKSIIMGKREKGLTGFELYIHVLIIFVLSWIVVWSFSFWWAALVIAVVHLIIDATKAVVERKRITDYDKKKKPIHNTRFAVWPFVIDQALHVALIGVVAWWWLNDNDWNQLTCVKSLGTHNQLIALALLLCWKPANLLVKYILKYCQVKVIDNNHEPLANFKLGALIGTLERWLIIFFMSIHQYAAIGILVAAKSIRDFGVNRENERSEYVLAGTILSISIGVAAGLLLLI